MTTRTAILYARVSTDEQARSGYSLAQQLEALREWAAREGYEVLEEITDPGHSGAYLERPGLDRVRDLVAAGGVAAVVAQDRDRFAREPAYLYLLRREFEEHGTKLRALNDHGDESPEGELTDGILDQLAKFERAKIAERSRRGLTQKVREGKVLRGRRRPYGFDFTDDGEALVVNEPEMAAVRSIFRHVGVEGASLGEVARRLQSAGMPAPGAGSGEAGSPWHRNSIRYLIRSDLYRPLTAAEVAASGLVSQEAARGLDPARSYALWTYGKRRRKTRRVRGEGGESRDRHTYDERPREEWSAAAVDLTDAHLLRDHVDAARERISNNRRRPPSTVAQRFWQLSGGIARCAECGCALSPNAMKRKSSGAIAAYYRCTQKYNSGPRDCPNGRSMRAEAFEQAVWDAIYALLSDPERLRRQHRAHVERKRAELRGDPDREAAALAGRLQKLERRRSGYLDQEADGIMGREELRAKLAGLEAQRKELEGALREAQGRRQSIEELERQWHTYTQLAEHFDRLTYLVASDADRRRLYQALRLRVDVDAEGTIRLSGIFDPDLYLLDVLSDFPRDPSEPVPKVPAELGTRIVVTPDSSQPRAS